MTHIFVIFYGFLQMMVLVQKETQQTGDIFLHSRVFLTLLYNPLNVPHNVAVYFLITHLFLQSFLKHLSFFLKILQFGYLIPVPIHPSVDLERTGEWLVRHH